MERDKNKVFKLEGKLQHYDWGGISFLPKLLGIPNQGQMPFAEYWMGAHDQASAELLASGDQKIKLNEYIKAFPDQTLGAPVWDRFGRLPYLLKILDVKDMLSIQVHPTKRNAEKEFEAENNRGVNLNDAHRNYKDDNHKPELMYALSEFWLLHGFKAKEPLLHALERVPELNFLITVFAEGSYELMYRTVMEMEQKRVDELLGTLLQRILPAYRQDRLEKNDEDFWAARAALTFNHENHIDRGIFSIYFFNLLNLHPGEAIFQDAGLPHAYLEGQNVEIMANSDNVLRGGLTTKHIDVIELMKHIQFCETIPVRIGGRKISAYETVFPTPAPDFELSIIELQEGNTLFAGARGAEIYFVVEGEVEIAESAGRAFPCNRGEAFLAFDNAGFRVNALKKTVICKASVP
jgi:mannose-6-phosphate isomerase